MYAVVRTGGKQYRVQEGRSITIERLPGEAGDSVELGEVLLMDVDGSVTVGSPTIAGARVVGTIAEQGRAKKIIVFRYKAKTRARKKNGHRQQFTKLSIDSILAPGEKAKAKPKPEAKVAEPAAEAAPVEDEITAVADEAAVEPVSAVAPDEAAEVEAPAKPKRTRKKAE